VIAISDFCYKSLKYIICVLTSQEILSLVNGGTL